MKIKAWKGIATSVIDSLDSLAWVVGGSNYVGYNRVLEELCVAELLYLYLIKITNEV